MISFSTENGTTEMNRLELRDVINKRKVVGRLLPVSLELCRLNDRERR